MLNLKTGIIEEIIECRGNVVELFVRIGNDSEKAIAYKTFTDGLEKGNEVILNTTAKDLKLGTGGYHFVVADLSNTEKKSSGYGHIMKLRYTPMQIKVNSMEEQSSKYHEVFNKFKSLEKMPVLVCGLHSMLAPLAIILKSINSNLRIGYIMTDGAALPIDFSKNVHFLKKRGYIDGSITVGHAFGGDFECVNIYNGLITAKDILKCDICIVAMGPGIVGTGTKYGFTGTEQGKIIDAVNDLNGSPICVPRISFNDKRERHFGISHHTITVLNLISKTRAYVGIPAFDDDKESCIRRQISRYGIDKKHDVLFMGFNDIIDVLKKSDFVMETMGRTLKDDEAFFLSVGVNAKIAHSIIF
ncbi:DUF3866 family protein [Wukongibacter baidiensis]|uniref:DUF3866 family protein n=1 Tax=Wukongibacter baidiensis TaxID=1723361 RepID=UPI003D7F6918